MWQKYIFFFYILHNKDLDFRKASTELILIKYFLNVSHRMTEARLTYFVFCEVEIQHFYTKCPHLRFCFHVFGVKLKASHC